MVANYRRVGGRAVFITTVRCRIAYDIVIDVATDPTRPDPRSRSVLLSRQIKHCGCLAAAKPTGAKHATQSYRSSRVRLRGRYL